MLSKTIFHAMIVSLISLTTTTTVRSQAPNVEDDAEQALSLNSEAARLYTFEIGTETPRELVLNPTSLLRWSNPVAGEIYGNVFVWTYDGRPEVVTSIFQWYSPHTHGSHEFQSLSQSSISGYREGESVWTSPTAGIKLQPLPEPPRVADSSPARLRQARVIANGFRIKKTDREDVSRELRLLAQPLIRYRSESAGVVDGAMFVFVQGTDPEVFLMVEARQSGGKLRWEYGLARMNSVQFVARYREEPVWRVDTLGWGEVKSGRGTYTSFGPFERK